MERMGKETRRMLYWLLAVCLAAAAGFTALLSYMTNDFQKTMVEHNYGTAGYLVNHPDTNVAAAFTKDKTDADLEAGRRILKEAGYHENTNPRMVPAVAAYQKRTAVMLGGMLFSVFAGVFLTVWIYVQRQRKVLVKADTVITRFLSGDMGQRIDSEETGGWYSLFHRINELAAILSAQAEHEKQTREFLQDMISDVSHQLKTPLAALKMYDEIMAQEGTDRETIHAFSQKSLREIRRVEDVVYMLLKIARLDAGTVRMEKAEENMEMLLKDVTERFEMLAAQEAKEIVLSGSSDVSLYCDALWMSEALGNVVKNALEHTGRGGKVVISWERTPLLTNIVVEDNGTGIHQEDIHNIFKRFYRSHISQDTHGIGLGLPLAKSIVEAHQGTISVTSKVGQGSRFVLSFFHLTKE
ncbi:HAMP domain-containing sensor histidine kinase [Lachnospiraceae bacterium JLR.KK009]